MIGSQNTTRHVACFTAFTITGLLYVMRKQAACAWWERLHCVSCTYSMLPHAICTTHKLCWERVELPPDRNWPGLSVRHKDMISVYLLIKKAQLCQICLCFKDFFLLLQRGSRFKIFYHTFNTFLYLKKKVSFFHHNVYVQCEFQFNFSKCGSIKAFFKKTASFETTSSTLQKTLHSHLESF